MTYTKVAASSQEDDDDDAADKKPATHNGNTPHSNTSAEYNGRTAVEAADDDDDGGGGGFTTVAALERLDEDIAALLHEYEADIRGESLLTKAQHFLRHPSDTPLASLPIFFTLLTIVGLLVAAHFASALLLTATLAATIWVCAREHSLRRTELHRKVRHVLGELRLARRLCADWTDLNYPNLCSPLSPCVTLQWTYRDGRIVNLPWALLVRDDLVVLRPGQVAPAACVAVADTAAHAHHQFAAGETYGVAQPSDPPLKPVARAPLPDLRCRLLETPYLENLRVSLAKFAQRPTTVYNLQRYLLVTKYIQVWGALGAFAVTWTVAALRWHNAFDGGAGSNIDWVELFVLAPACAVLPILPLVFPLLWIAVNLWGVARLQTLLGMPTQRTGSGAPTTMAVIAVDADTLAGSAGGESSGGGGDGSDGNGGPGGISGEPGVEPMNSVSSATPAGSIDATSAATAAAAAAAPSTSITFHDDDSSGNVVDLDTPTYDWERRPLPRRTVLRCWLALWRGDSRLLGRSANVVQVLGSVTALCCVDKKGILSWPNPTAEKVFFLRDGETKAKQEDAKAAAQEKMKCTTEATATSIAAADETSVLLNPHDGTAQLHLHRHAGAAAPSVIVGQLASQTSMDSDNSQPPHHHSHHQGKGGATAGGAVAEVLDLTHDQHSPFRLAFDDHAWSAHLQSLKPLGLAILVNTCCPLTQAHYAQFCNHVTAVAMLDKDLVPVTNRYEIVESRLNSFMHGRCLCELAKQIGFTDNARDIFQLEGQIASYMHLQPDVVRRDIRFARQLHLASKVKVPFPHCLSVVMRESPGNSLQLLTQGTADIVLDCCDDYWDGRDLRPLSAQERKRAQDFYQRSALTAYCTAFAYRPLRHGITGALAGITGTGPGRTAYLELPPEMRYRMKQQRTPSFTYDVSDHNAAAAAAAARLHQHSLSTDSLLFAADSDADGDHNDGQYHRRPAHRQHHRQHHHQPAGDANEHIRPKRLQGHHFAADASAAASHRVDVDGCFEMQCHQVFIGMVTMQYQAQTDIVQLIERLDQACVRFVHFSKENELRSRVFSEKMGLESGWNCHISLLSKSSSTLPSPRHSQRNAFGGDSPTAESPPKAAAATAGELNRLLAVPVGCGGDGSFPPRHPSTASAPGIISTATASGHPDDSLHSTGNTNTTTSPSTTDNSFELDELPAPTSARPARPHRDSKDSAMEDENCRSLSSLTVSTEQSAPINFDMSNRAKLPRGIENIQPHLENVDNVPLLVSLFTDCSAEATREMLGIMQRHGEIVVCLGSSASNANAEIFLQADCGIGVEPLYPQVCQDIAAYTEVNLVGNRRRAAVAAAAAAAAVEELKVKTARTDGDVECGQCLEANNDDHDADADADDEATNADGDGATVSPVYLSRILNSVACSISICRDESLSIVALIELSRRFSNGLWSCIQFWASCACSLALMNTLCACAALPPVLTPGAVLWLMGVAVPLLAVTLVRTDGGERVMNRATGKKHTRFESGVFGFVMFCYGCKFLPSTVIMMLSYCTFVSHPVVVLDTRAVYDDDFSVGVDCARAYILLAVMVHYVCISTSFVHRDFSIWRKNPATNAEWVRMVLVLLAVQLARFAYDMLRLPELLGGIAKVWPIVVLLFGSVLVVAAITEICKWEELKVNARQQRRARLDFGTKLGMNSPF